MLTVIVDGDNVVRALGLRAPPAVEKFLQELEMAAVTRDWEATVVFDGPERFLPRPAGPAGGPAGPLVVRYAAEASGAASSSRSRAMGKTADTLIERAVYEAPNRGQVVVVTQDRNEANIVLGFGARVWSADRLRQELKLGSGVE